LNVIVIVSDENLTSLTLYYTMALNTRTNCKTT
jgi:hypothetical protein